MGLFINVEIAQNMTHDTETMRLYGQVLTLIVFRNFTSVTTGAGQVINTTVEQKYEEDFGILAGYKFMNITYSSRLGKYTLTNVTISISLRGSNILIKKVTEKEGIPVETYYVIVGFVIFDAILAFVLYKKK